MNELSNLDQFRNAAINFQDFCLTLPQVEVEINHYFSPDSYAREMRVVKGTVLVGKIHRHSHINILSYGSCSILTEDGVMTISAPHTFVSRAGAKRIFHADTDFVFTTIHATTETDMKKLEEYLIAPTFNDLNPEELMRAVK